MMKGQNQKNINSPNQKPIKLFIEDFGPIEKAEIELGDFTAIIGPNSSGKTFIINLVDRIMAFASNLFMFAIPNGVFRAVDEILIKKQNKEYPISINMSEYPDETIHQIVDYAMNNFSENGIQQNADANKIYTQLLFQNLQYFQTYPQNLIQFGKDHARIIFDSEQMKIDITISQQGQLSVKFAPDYEFWAKYVRQFTANFAGKGGGSYGSLFPLRGFQNVLIPTERLSVLVTMPNIIEDLAKSRGFKNLFPAVAQVQQIQADKPFLIEFMSNYLNAIQNLTVSKKEISKNASDLIMGSLTLNLNLPFFIVFREGENSVPLNLISSGTLQLIPLVLLAESDINNTLLIEEPELNLHVNKQVEVAEYLWNLIEERNKNIFVSTHSDYFLMKLAHLSKNNRNKTLRVYLLNKGHITPLKISKEGEIEEIETIGTAINKLLLET